MQKNWGNKVYRSVDEAYPFLSEVPEKLYCDFEILTDEIASMTGLLACKAPEEFKEELLKVDELIYHLNPSVRTFYSIEADEERWLAERKNRYQIQFPEVRFVLPAGSEAACLAHIIRVKCKELVRLLYRIGYSTERQIDERVFDFANLLSNYFFYLALMLNRAEGVEEKEFISRNYKGI